MKKNKMVLLLILLSKMINKNKIVLSNVLLKSISKAQKNYGKNFNVFSACNEIYLESGSFSSKDVEKAYILIRENIANYEQTIVNSIGEIEHILTLYDPETIENYINGFKKEEVKTIEALAFAIYLVMIDNYKEYMEEDIDDIEARTLVYCIKN